MMMMMMMMMEKVKVKVVVMMMRMKVIYHRTIILLFLAHGFFHRRQRAATITTITSMDFY
jgi:hypothetical protein